jgi:hypothetical protein
MARVASTSAACFSGSEYLFQSFARSVSLKNRSADEREMLVVIIEVDSFLILMQTHGVGAISKGDNVVDISII